MKIKILFVVCATDGLLHIRFLFYIRCDEKLFNVIEMKIELKNMLRE